MAAVIDVTEETFASEVLQSAQPVLVDFWAPWCGPCRMVGPAVEQLAGERDDVRVVKVNVDDAQRLAAHYNIMSIPALMVFKDGREVQRLVGALPKDRIAKALDAAL